MERAAAALAATPVKRVFQEGFGRVLELSWRAGRIFEEGGAGSREAPLLDPPLGEAMAASGRKIMVFLSVVVMIVLIIGTLMYVLEGPAYGFTSIPMSVYWAISTMTTVGYGDIVPRTDIGRTLASIMMLMGWGVLAVPTRHRNGRDDRPAISPTVDFK